MCIRDSFYWLFVLSPVILALNLFNFMTIYECHNSPENVEYLSKLFLTIFSGASTLLLTTFLVLLGLRIDGILTIQYNVLFIPLYIELIILFVFILFIVPGLIDSEHSMYREAIIIVLHYICFAAFIVMLGLKLDNSLELSYAHVTGALLLSFGFHWLTALSQLIMKDEKKPEERLSEGRNDSGTALWEFIIVTLITAFLAMLFLNEFSGVGISWIIVLAPIVILWGILAVLSILDLQ
eukprot:TRINITY_DN5543_c0_g1_i3.p1 TRINITY_DN5543_c0_g1~~TRINITY_DN5543_c0_g1_i3.p1  ORF type:complete len:238 (+),score=49.11 TRINITY_DN5543_c0_g1_i3:65-778(+)